MPGLNDQQTDLRQFEFLQPYVNGWMGKIALAQKSKEWFTNVGNECMTFFCGSAQQFWDPRFLAKYVQGGLNPQFKMVMAKAFEYVALAGPSLFWKTPHREIHLKRKMDFDEEKLQAIGDPMLMQMVAQALQWQTSARATDELRAWPLEQPKCGLESASMMALIEAMIKGRGLVWTEPFQMPGSERTLTGSFFDSVDNLLIDPDAESLEGAEWICRVHHDSHWKLEERFQWARGSLKKASAIESANYQGQALGNDAATLERMQRQSQDQVTWYEIFSNCGPGTRLSGVTSPISDHLDSVVGKYAYIAIAPGIPCPLNVKSMDLRPTEWNRGATDEDVSRMFRWPLPTWTDERWPCVALDFYPKPRSAWPIPPMGPGIGELIFLNVFSSHLANRTWSSSRDFIVIMERACDRIEEVMKSGDDLAIIKLKESHGKIDECLQFIKQNEASGDSWRVLDMMAERFADRVGLPDVWYAKNPGGRMPRTATDVESRKDFSNIRVDYMGGLVETWQENMARNEMLAMRIFSKPQDYEGLFGPAELLLYERLVHSEPIETVVREMRAIITAGSARKPNKERDSQNINATVATMLPVLTEYAAATGDSGPVNEYFRLWLNAIEMDAEGIEFGPWVPQPPPGSEEQAQLEQQKMQNDLALSQLNLQGKEIDITGKQIQAQALAQKHGLDLDKAQLDLQISGRRAALDMATREQEHSQGMRHSRQSHLLEMMQNRAEGAQKIDQMQAESRARIAASRAAARAKPKPSKNGKATAASKK